MNMGKIKGMCLCMAICLLVPKADVYGQTPLKLQGYTAGGEEGENVSVTTNEEGSLEIQFSFEEEGYHTVTAFLNDKQELEKERGIRFTVENRSGIPARMNMAVINHEGTVLQVKDGCYVRLLGQEGESYALAENGCFELPQDFSGDVELPFELYASEFGEAGKETLKEIMGYGMVCVTEGQSPCHLVFHQMSFADKGDLKDAREGAFLAIEGADGMLRSDVGESKEQYKGIVYNMLGKGEETQVSFSIQGEGENIFVEDGGWVTVQAGAQGDSFSLMAETGDGMKAVKEIMLKESWTKQVLTENGYDASIAPPSEISSVEGSLAVLTEERSLWTIRILLVAGVVTLFTYYSVIRRRNRKKEA